MIIGTPAYRQRRARRRLIRLALCWILGSFGAGILYLSAGYYLPLFI